MSDRAYGSSVWQGKPGAVVSVSPGAIGAFGANHVVRQSMVFLGVPMLPHEAYIGGVTKLFDEEGVLARVLKSFSLNSLLSIIPGSTGCRHKGKFMSKNKAKKTVGSATVEDFLLTLQTRFENNMGRHKGSSGMMCVRRSKRILKSSRCSMKWRARGEPDVVGFDKKTGEYISFTIIQAESPKERRSLCYNQQAA